jgi:cytochrome c oxidase subunit 2
MIMRLGEYARSAGHMAKAPAISLITSAVMLLAPQLAWAQAAATSAASAAATAANRFAVAPGGYVPMKPTTGIGMPVPGGIGLQTQFSPLGHYAQWFHDGPLLWLAGLISIFVLVLLLWVVVRYNSRANPVASKNSHNTFIEIVWTLVPVLILVGVAVPSIDLLAKQFKSPPAKTLTIKATGNQWFWTYSYPDNGGFEVVSNMLPDEEAVRRGEPAQLGADFRMVVPAGEPIRMQITGSDVIHSFAVPSLWFKLDGVPGRINEKVLFIEKPGVYFGQCSELCGARHGYMPIAVEALPRPQYNAWVLTQSGGKIDGAPEPAPAAVAPAAAAAPAAASTAPAATPAASATPAPKA